MFFIVFSAAQVLPISSPLVMGKSATLRSLLLIFWARSSIPDMPRVIERMTRVTTIKPTATPMIDNTTIRTPVRDSVVCWAARASSFSFSSNSSSSSSDLVRTLRSCADLDPGQGRDFVQVPLAGQRDFLFLNAGRLGDGIVDFREKLLASFGYQHLF